MKKVFSLLAFLFVLTSYNTFAQTTRYTTGTGGDWNTASTWSGGNIPNSTTHATINSNDDVSVASIDNVSCINLLVDIYLYVPGTLEINGTLTITGNLNVYGPITINNGGEINRLW